jgi:YidC/Oxa1 family membrane protein insertase
MGFFEIFAAALAGFYALIPSFGVAIILLTLATRVLLLPLSIKQTRSMREMQKIQPQVKKLQQKHKGDRQKMNEEMMALYKEHSVNPFGGCLPLLLQFPVLIGLYRVIRQPLLYLGYSLPKGATQPVANAVGGLASSVRDSALANDLLDKALQVNHFLGLRLDCSLLEAARGQGSLAIPGQACGTGNLVLSALPYVVLIGLMGYTTFFQQKQMQATRTPGDQQAQQMQMVGRVMPLILVVFGLQFPAALVLYWLTTNLWTIVQQRLILGRLGPAPAPAAPAPKPGGEGKGAKGAQAASDGSAAGSAKKPAQRSPNGAKKAAAPKGQANGAKRASTPASKKKKKR